VLLLQEVVGGILVGTPNSAEDLRDLLLDEHNLNYFLRTAFETGVTGLLSTANAILSRFEIESSDNHRLPWVTEEEFLGFDVKLPRNVIQTRLLIPSFGEVDVFNTHLCARCSLEDREDQLDEVFDFIEKFQNAAGAPRPTVLGGDMNFDLFANNGDERFLYGKVLEEGFSDAYAKYIIAAANGQETLETLCEKEDNADEHCTVGVSDLNGSNARRIDYIFARGFGPPVQSQVVFNPNAPNGVPPTVSDHAAVVVHLHLPLPNLRPEIITTGDLDGSGQEDVIIDFGEGYGIWGLYNDTSWEQLHPYSAAHIATGDLDGSGQDDVIIDFGEGYGIWVWSNDTSWEQIHPYSAANIATGDLNGSGQNDVIIDFGEAYGIWVFYNDTSWEQLHNLSP
jgi:maltose 6'-phosphate phosphatase